MTITDTATAPVAIQGWRHLVHGKALQQFATAFESLGDAINITAIDCLLFVAGSDDPMLISPDAGESRSAHLYVFRKSRCPDVALLVRWHVAKPWVFELALYLRENAPVPRAPDVLTWAFEIAQYIGPD